jgi:serine/threonine-protein kinase
VFTASHPADGEVVIKLIKPLQDPERVRREVETVRRLGSARVPQVFETGAVDSPLGRLLWLREARIYGESLRALISVAPLDQVELFRLGDDVFEALEDAERLGVVHRDVKPENILRNRDSRYWLLDFGVARHLELESLTPTAAPWGVGTLGYSPPEQLRNFKARIDHRSDLFSVGVVLYEAVTGANPFTEGARDHHEVVERMESLIPQPLPGDCDATGALGRLVGTLLQKYPDRRPASVSEAREWLREIAHQAGV